MGPGFQALPCHPRDPPSLLAPHPQRAAGPCCALTQGNDASLGCKDRKMMKLRNWQKVGIKQAQHERAMCPDSKGGYQPLELNVRKIICQRIEGGGPSPLLSTGEAASGVLCPVLVSPVQEIHGLSGVSPVKSHKGD
ncbi:hypothetical protein QYF61_008354 [Mycteria americana]|uniref:Uncharacterized protein n=1 Tax=Mycteria americana TaxID=33587 RepID=A0AAN7SBM9_MYCAM|nr:hypothetical protein QYF61_008354 [Mycteria americana]